MTDFRSMSLEDLEDHILSAVAEYGLRVQGDWREIKRRVDMFDYHQRTIEQAMRELDKDG
jgi:hypothetical protein